jgi:DNA-binding SARP family transcriptional activator
LQARLIVALAAVGQQALALERYQLVRGCLAEELGIDPGPALRSAHEKVLRQLVAVEPAVRRWTA